MSWIALTDEIEAVRFAIENERISDAVNLTAPTPVTNAEFTAALGRSLGRPAPWVVPAFAMRLMLGEFADEGVLTGARVLPAVLSRNGFTFRYPDLDEALSVATGRTIPVE
jgi:NAD dependent epimerase/dehydratase family enzyme